MMLRRISSQINQVKLFLRSVLGLEPPQSNQRADLVRDKFGLHKMIVAVTSIGKVIIIYEYKNKFENILHCVTINCLIIPKIFGIETRKGEIIWQVRVPNLQGLSKDSNKMILYLQRSSRHFPHPPQCALIAANKVCYEILQP